MADDGAPAEGRAATRCRSCAMPRASSPVDRSRPAPAHPAQRPRRPHAEPGRLPEEHPRPRHHLRHRPGRHRQDLPRGRLRRRRARAQRGAAHHPHAAGGRGRRAPRLPARRPGAEGRSLPAAALRRALRPDGTATASARRFEKATLEVAPLAFMRGRTLNHAFVILDEAQNTTPEQMKMFLTRIGFGSKAVVTGDVSQIDLPKGTDSGLVRRRARPAPRRGHRAPPTSPRPTWCAIRWWRASSRPTGVPTRRGTKTRR